ncbi:hypothetical protein Pa4123_62220 [Phytohabitans aurantiacus]|uniref:HTH cro/C1-type domain-containing protein n=1 Tax=Phytohabitans aurantiacus TaxID=3016789 RepID=A0ABQ5R2J4_9ACTN|nr:hypothetical protein Pa4123_62220 [Phytohabitans aurantiacus]
MAGQNGRRCTACQGVLSSYNAAAICAACLREGPAVLIPPVLWYRPAMRDALEDHDFGRVSRLLQEWTPLTQRQVAEMIGMEQPGLSKIENNKQRVRHIGVFFRFVEGLGIPLELVLPPALRADGGRDPMKRRVMIAGGAGMAAEAISLASSEAGERLSHLIDQADQGDSGRRPRIGRNDVRDLRDTVDDLYNLDARLGGDRLWRFALAQLRLVEVIFDNFTYSDAIGHDLQGIMGELKTSVGWYSFDANLQQQAHQNLTEALNLAYMTSDTVLVVRTLANMARQAVHLGRYREAVVLSQRGLENAGRSVTPRMRALLAIREAHGWAGMRQEPQCDDAIRRARAEFERGSEAGDPEWLSFFSEAGLLGLEGMARSGLGQYQAAETLLKRSIGLRSKDGSRRNLGIGLVYLSKNSLRQKNYAHAGRVAGRAAALAGEITSGRVRSELGDLGRKLSLHDNVPEVAEALERIVAVSGVSEGKGRPRGTRSP